MRRHTRSLAETKMQAITLSPPTFFLHSLSLVARRSLFLPYVNKKAKDKKSFTASDAEFYVFGVEGREEGWGEGRGLVRVDEKLVRRIREGFGVF